MDPRAITGLGDLIKWACGAIGITQCPDCKDRQQYLNERFPFRRQISDGSLVFPRSEPYPHVPGGYERDTKNPYIMRIKIEPCQFRTETKIATGCCKVKRVDVCTKYQTRTDRLNCSNCQAHAGNNEKPSD